MPYTDDELVAMLRDSRGTLRELDRIECRESLASFIKRGWSQIEPSTVYKHGRHIDAIADHLEAVTDGHITRLLINVPPGTLKSLSTSVFWPAWEWGPRQMPGLRIIGTSYSERYATRDNGRMRNLVTSEWYQERWGDLVNLTKFGERKFENTAYGWREAIPFASLTAGRGDRLIIDDPHSTESAESDAERETTIRIFLESVPTRLNDPEKSAIVIIMQRLHEEDVSGAALAHDLGYVHLMLPMEYDPSRHCVTYLPDTGEQLFSDWRKKDRELLFPDRFPRQVIEGYRSSMGPYAFAGQMQQMPVPRGGGIFHWDWWQLWGNPDDSEDERFKRFPTMDYVVASLDSAYTEKEENDFSALTLWGVFREAPGDVTVPKHYLSKQLDGVEGQSRTMQRSMGGPKVMLMTAWQARLPLHELVERVAKTCTHFKADRLLIEAKASGISVAQEVRRLHAGSGWGVQLIDPGRQDKIARAYSVQHVFADGMVYAPDREWAEMVQSQMATFPKTAHKDLTDSATQAIRHLRDIGMLQHAAEIERDTKANSAYKSSTSKPLYPA
jgi:predicted phage terminase large subunit-like protein